MTQLPAGWAIATVGALGEYVNGRGFKKSEWANTGRPIIRIQNLTGSGSTFNYYDGPLEDRHVVPAGSLLVSWAATLGVYVWNGPEGALNQHIFKVNSYIDPGFHRYVLQHALEVMRGSTHGSGMVHITRGKFDETPIQVPPVPEQLRIVAAIEDAFSLLDAGEASLHATRTRLKRMRDSVLAAAVTGQLVPQDPTVPPAVPGWEVADAQMELPLGWKSLALGSVLREPMRNGMSAVRSSADGGLPIFSISAVTTGDFGERNIKLTAGDWGRAAELWAQPGDIFVQRSNTPELVGTARLYRGRPGVAVFPDLLIRIRPNPNWCLPEWLELVLSAPQVRRLVRSQAKGLSGSMPKISQPVLARLPVPIPSGEEQARIVVEVERQISFIEAAERTLEGALVRSTGLRRSVLKAAFEGRLVPQDSSDEPASVLLERIALQTAGPKKVSRRGRAKVEAS